ncbi:MAG: LysM peptidoglycan-binding domain-containing protein [Lachnospiraceae bacterium]|nr:MAG: LysM peptidoglycan-binding domain-containing protein [Lachnospiraceae bacterium]
MNYDTCDGMTYTIKQGDTLYGISRKYDVPLAMILHANPYADVYRLNVGDTICIPMKKKCCKKPCSSGNRGMSEDNDSSMNNGMGVENNITGNLNVSDGMIETRRNKEMPDNMAGTRQSTGMPDNMTGTRQSTGMSDNMTGTRQSTGMSDNMTRTGRNIGMSDNMTEIRHSTEMSGDMSENRRNIGISDNMDMSESMDLPDKVLGARTDARSAGMSENKASDDDKWVKYVAQPGDTLFDVFNKSDCDLNEFLNKNGLKGIYILPGLVYFVKEK